MLDFGEMSRRIAPISSLNLLRPKGEIVGGKSNGGLKKTIL